ncbi:MAG: DUF3486 family protein [Treponema sp.]|nr:DUF3486 family protein [Treponema sp.]
MPKRNKIEMQGLVERIVSMFYEEKRTQAEITEILKDEGWDVSKSGVGRTLLDYKSQMDAYRDAAKKAAMFAEELKDKPGVDVIESAVQVTAAKLMSEAMKFQDFSNLSTQEVIKSISSMASSQAAIAKVRLEYERGYRNGLFKAADVVESEGKKAGLSKEVIEKFKSSVLGIKVEDETKG